MDEGLAALLGALVGGSLTAGAQIWLEHRKARVTTRNLVIAMAAEAAAVAELVRRRSWIEGIADYAKEAQTGNVQRYSVHLPDQVLTCSRAAAGQAGLLPGRLSGLVARLVMLGDGIAADLRRLAAFPIDHPDGFLHSEQPNAAANLYAEILAVMVDALWTCDRIVLESKQHFPKETAFIVITRSSDIENFTREAMTTGR